MTSATLTWVDSTHVPGVTHAQDPGELHELSPLSGRRSECEALDRLLERGGRSGALVVRGEPGIGKTVLAEYAIDSARDLRVVRTVGVESEMELEFGALHQFCLPFLDRLERLAEPQREALGTVFGLCAGPPPDRFLVGLAVLSLLSDAAEKRPILCVVDDAQWLDHASAKALGFVARRLLAESVLLVLVTRDANDDFGGLQELLVEGLRETDARELLSSAVRGPMDVRVSEQIVAETRGNPLALLELLRGLSPAQLAGGFGLPGALYSSGRIEKKFVRQLGILPESSQRLLLIAAAEPLGDPALLWRAADRLGITDDVLEPAESIGLIEIDSRVRFRHPSARSAIYRAAPPQERRQAHRALAEATDAQADPDWRAWHHAEATAGPDEHVAAELEQAAGRAQARGGVAAGASFLERAARLTSEPRRRAQRALTAAQAKYQPGAFDDALALLDTADACILGDPGRARVDRLRAQIAFASRRDSEAAPLLLKAARKLEAVDPNLARVTYLEALQAALSAGRLARGAGVGEVAQAALGAPPPQQPRRAPDLLLEGLAIQFTDGCAAGAPIVKHALDAFRRETAAPPEEVRWLSLASRAAADVWDDEAWRLLSGRALEHARDAGALTEMPLALSTFGHIHAISGDLPAAEVLIDQIRAATEATGIPSHPCVALWVEALRGREAELSELVETTDRDALSRGEGFALGIAAQVSAVLNNGLGRYDVALAAVRQAVDVEPSDEMGSPRTMPELIEAAVRCGERRLAERALERLAASTRASGTDWALGVEARSRALLSEGETAGGLYREAIERLGRTRVRVQLARVHLVYGEWLRRERRRVDARQQLRTALEMFTSMGAEAFAARAERELLATGEHARKRSAETRDQLTAQETQIARLARDGLSNPEIGERLFISPHTVAYHLRKVFSKLDVSSRCQLDGVLA
jgi:DNA-binding CsgD family transcriptional regulator